MKYCIQPTKYSCGPIAILNALKWSGQKVSLRKSFKYLCDKCNLGKSGVTVDNFDSTLRSLLSVERIKLPTLNDLVKVLEDNTIILRHVLETKSKNTHGHYTFIYDNQQDQMFYAANYYNKHAIIIRGDMKRLLHPISEYPEMWIIKRRESNGH